jgi:hypothetical protein
LQRKERKRVTRSRRQRKSQKWTWDDQT